MPLPKETKPFNEAPKQPVHQTTPFPDAYKHSIVDSRELPVDSILTYIEGLSWTIDYYSQLLNINEEPKDFNFSQTGPYQQYELIKRYQIKLQSELSTTFSTTQNRATVTGTARLYPGLVPNKGDVIIGDIGDGRAGLFTVTQTQQMAIYKNTCYEIEFELYQILDAKISKTLENRTVKTLYFHEDFITYGQNPMLISSEAQLVKTLNESIEEVLGAWAAEFYSHEIRTFQVPQDGAVVFDPFLTSAMLKVFSGYDQDLFGKVSLYNCDEGYLKSYTDIWDAIIRGKSYLLKTSFSRYQLVPSNRFSNNVHLRSIRYSNIDYVVMPLVTENSINDPLDVLKYRTGITLTGTIAKVADEDLPPVEGRLGAPNLIGSADYVLNRSVYKLTDDPVSNLEQEVRNYFQQEAVNPRKVLEYVERRHELSELQRFYLLPICLFMMMYSLRSI